MRYRVRATFPNGQPVIVKVTADNVFQGMAQAGREFADAGHNIAQLQNPTIRQLGAEKSGVYVGQVPTGKSKRGRKPQTPANEQTPPAQPAAEAQPQTAAAPAPTPAPTQTDKPKSGNKPQAAAASAAPVAAVK